MNALMWIPIGISLLAFTLFFFVGATEYGGWLILRGILAGMFAGVIAFTVSAWVLSTTATVTVIDGGADLVALSNSEQVEGHFFLGSGVIKGENVYSFMADVGNGGYKMGSVYADYATIFETTDNPHVDYIYDKTREGIWPKQRTYTGANIYIPEGSIWQGYDVDVRN